VRELFWLARLGRQVRYEKGQVLFERGQPAHAVEFLLDGHVSVAGGDTLAAPAVLGFEEVLDGAPIQRTVTAAERAITLSLTTDEFLSLLSENVELAQGLFRMLIETRGLAEGHTLLPGDLPPDIKAEAQQELRPIDRLLLFQSSPLLRNATAAQLWALSAIARPVTLAAGRDAMERTTEASILIVLSGTLTLDSGDGSPQTADAGDVIGLYETLAGAPMKVSIRAAEPASVLRLDREALFELLADHTDLLQRIFSMLLRRGTVREPAAV
jgi:CRP-like cAMP-binding protein